MHNNTHMIISSLLQWCCRQWLVATYRCTMCAKHRELLAVLIEARVKTMPDLFVKLDAKLTGLCHGSISLPDYSAVLISPLEHNHCISNEWDM